MIKKTRKQFIHNIIVGALKETIRVHRKISKQLIGSAAKRIVGALFAKGKENENIHSNTN